MIREKARQREKRRVATATATSTETQDRNEIRREREKGNCLKRRSPPGSQHTTPTIRGKMISHNDVGDGRGGGKRSKQKMATGSKVLKYQLGGESCLVTPLPVDSCRVR